MRKHTSLFLSLPHKIYVLIKLHSINKYTLTLSLCHYYFLPCVTMSYYVLLASFVVELLAEKK